METNLTNFGTNIPMTFSNNRCKSVKCIRTDHHSELLILKQNKRKSNYIKERNLYLRFNKKINNYLPVLKYYDNKNKILAITYCGNSLQFFTKKKKKFDIKKINKKIKNLCYKFHKDYKLCHDDLCLRNICIDDQLNLYLIDFERVSKKKRPKYITL